MQFLVDIFSSRVTATDVATSRGNGKRFLEFYLVGTFQAEHLPGFNRCRRLEAEFFDNAAYFCDLLGIARRQFPRTDVERVFETDAHIAADHRGCRAEIELVAAAGKHRP